MNGEGTKDLNKKKIKVERVEDIKTVGVFFTPVTRAVHWNTRRKEGSPHLYTRGRSWWKLVTGLHFYRCTFYYNYIAYYCIVLVAKGGIDSH